MYIKDKMITTTKEQFQIDFKAPSPIIPSP